MTLKNIIYFIKKLAALNPDPNPDRFVVFTEAEIYIPPKNMKPELHKLWLKNLKEEPSLKLSTNTYTFLCNLENVGAHL